MINALEALAINSPNGTVTIVLCGWFGTHGWKALQSKRFLANVAQGLREGATHEII